MREPFPLQWPEGWARTPFHERAHSRFITGMARALRELLVELDRLGAANVVITSDLPHRSSGLPYGSAPDTGVAVWFVLDGAEHVLACDRWRSAAENIHAIGLSIAAIRGIDRWGVRDVVARAFAGFQALPAGGQSAAVRDDGSRPWWVVLCIQRDVLEEPLATLAKARRSYRMLMRQMHPDTDGGSNGTLTAAAAELNVAMDKAVRELESEHQRRQSESIGPEITQDIPMGRPRRAGRR